MYSKPPGLEAALARDRDLEAKKAQQEAAAAAATDSSNAAAAAAGGGQQQPPQLPGQQQQQQQQQGQKQQRVPAVEEAMRQRQMELDKLREDPFAAILAARSALQTSDKFVLRNVEGVYGGTVPAAGNQMLLEDEPRADEGAAEVDGELGVRLGPGGGGEGG